MTLRASWRRLPLEGVPPSLAARSSHCLALRDGRAYIFGGEQQPRTPVGEEMLVVQTGAGASAVEVVNRLTQSTAWPTPRVGAAMTTHAASQSILLWGGRGGKEMTAIDVRQSDDDNDGEGEDVWRLDTQTHRWSQLRTHAATPSAFPVARSFHTLTHADQRLFVHAGCPAQGRLATLHALDLHTQMWQQLADAPEPARGGTVLTTLAGVAAADAPLLARWGGFCGEEVGGPLDVFDTTTMRWTSYDVKGAAPPKRSVHALVPFVSRRPVYVDDERVVALLLMGEGEGAPKELGHDGAGKFLDDAYALLRARNGTAYRWLALDVAAAPDGNRPEPRGWFAFDVQSTGDDGVEVVLHGGLNDRNERLADAWVLQVTSSG